MLLRVNSWLSEQETKQTVGGREGIFNQSVDGILGANIEKGKRKEKTEAGGKLTMLRPVGQREPVSQKIKAVR